MRNLLFSCIFLIFNCSISLSIGNYVVSARCPEDQRSLLLELKNNLAYPSNSSEKLVQWNETVDYCNWTGVSCDDGCVIGLDLSNQFISGGIDNSSSLFSLRFLRNLNLAFNRFNSTLPSAFDRLSNLSVLNMSNSGFVGQIPIEISSLTGLVTLDLTSSFFLQVSTLKLENPNLVTLVQNLSNLRVLILDGVDLSAEGREWCKALSSSSSLLSLRVLSLSTCSLSGPLDPSLVKLQYLSEIRLGNNNFSSLVPENFAEFSNLTLLHLSNSRLFGVFPQSIFQVSTLQTLDLSNNILLQGSLPDFQSNGPLQTLVLHATIFSGALPDSIGYFGNLTRLDLATCRFSGSIPNSIAKLTQLTYMDLSSNKFVGLIPSFSSLKNLTVLNLAHNRLNGSLLSTNWEELSNLVNLELRNNSFTGNVPLSLFHLPSIQKIQLCYNQFNGSLMELSHVSSSLLDTLALESNQLEGPFPLPFFDLRGLKILSLSFNKFTGQLNLNLFEQLKNISKLELSSNNLSVETDSIDSFPQLSTLRLASCKLKTFPGFLKNQSKLNSLDLSDNEIKGEIPIWIWDLRGLSQLNLSCNSLVGFQGSPRNLSSFLNLLDLHSNEFQGPLTFFPPSAAYLDFSNNNFSSVIPPDVGKYFQSTVFFSLSRNHIQGSIPESICNPKASLQVLDLSHNTLSGMFPQCLTKMTENLVVLNLRENALNGSIPNTFPVTCGLRTLDLSGNKFEGQVPKSISNCGDLEVLDLGNNQIHDIFPCPLKNISTLRVLVLRSNQFYGKFGCPGSHGTWPSLQIVDLSRNNFTGNISGKCIVKWKAMVDEEEFSNSRAKHIRFNFFKFSSVNYQDTVTITSKGLEVELTKILTVFTSIDFSCNRFDGHIPIELGQLRALYVLNLSHNSLSGEIPSSIGNLSQLGSLDLSRNLLTGTIPSQLARLSFLSVLNLSYNRLVGMIPIGTQIQSFPPDSFVGNEGLCGDPLPNKCKNAIRPKSDRSISEEASVANVDWQFIFIGVGFGVGAAAVVAPLMFLEVGRKWSDDTVDKILLAILPLIGYIYLTSSDRKVEPEDDSEDDDYIAGAYEHEESIEISSEFKGPYCVFCSKLDIYRKRVIHNPRCTCLCSLSPSSSFSTCREKIKL